MVGGFFIFCTQIEKKRPEELNTKQLLFFCVTYIKKDVGFSQDMYHKLNKKH